VRERDRVRGTAPGYSQIRETVQGSHYDEYQ
jgi:hypothetical protein